ncbi:hypothetical protein GCM10027277_20290 [Pseudoduganella ginsengisoli]
MVAKQMGNPDIILAQHQLQLAFAASRAKFTHRTTRDDILRKVRVIEAFAIDNSLRIEFN